MVEKEGFFEHFWIKFINDQRTRRILVVLLFLVNLRLQSPGNYI